MDYVCLFLPDNNYKNDVIAFQNVHARHWSREVKSTHKSGVVICCEIFFFLPDTVLSTPRFHFLVTKTANAKAIMPKSKRFEYLYGQLLKEAVIKFLFDCICSCMRDYFVHWNTDPIISNFRPMKLPKNNSRPMKQWHCAVQNDMLPTRQCDGIMSAVDKGEQEQECLMRKWEKLWSYSESRGRITWLKVE